MKTLNLNPQTGGLRLFSSLALAAAALLVVPACSDVRTPSASAASSDTNTTVAVTKHAQQPTLDTDSSGSAVITNPNLTKTVRVYWEREQPSLSYDHMDYSDVAPGQSVVIGSGTLNGAPCTYETSGWFVVPTKHENVARETRRAPATDTVADTQ